MAAAQVATAQNLRLEKKKTMGDPHLDVPARGKRTRCPPRSDQGGVGPCLSTIDEAVFRQVNLVVGNK